MTDMNMTVSRTIALAKPADEEAVGRVHRDGLVAIHAVAGGRRIEVTYDPRQLGLDMLEASLVAVGLEPSKGFFPRLARKWIAFRESNIREQAAIVHHCCNVPPDGNA